MLVDEARLVDDVEVPAPPFLQSERLVERQAQLAGDIVDRTGEQIRLQSSGILQDSHDNPVECGLLPPPGRVRLQDQKSVVQGKRVSVRVVLGGRRILTNKIDKLRRPQTVKLY